MRVKRQLISIAILTSLTLGLSGCGSSSSSDAVTNSAQDGNVIISENTYTGVFIDSAVEGLITKRQHNQARLTQQVNFSIRLESLSFFLSVVLSFLLLMQ